MIMPCFHRNVKVMCVCLRKLLCMYKSLYSMIYHEYFFGKLSQYVLIFAFCLQVFKRPTIVYNYPKAFKAFYMRLNDDNVTCAAMDILVPKIGELIGGSQREERLDVLERRCVESGLTPQDIWWYAELRKYGSVPHSGFGLGFERLLMFITGLENIRDVISFPRAPGKAEF